jgi:predicted Zn-dependent peptidase
VGGFGREDLTGFVARHYGPGRMILAAAGAVDHAAIVAQAEAAFGGLAAGPAPAAEAARFTPGERREVKRLEQAHVALAFETPGYRDPMVHTAQVFATALGGGMSSRLFQKLREERGLCYTVFAQGAAYADTGTLTIYAGTGRAEVGQLLHLTMDEFRRAAEDMSEAEVARARAQMKAGLLMGMESASARAERLARLLSIWGRVPAVAEQVAEIEAVTAEAVRAHAGAIAGAGRAAVALYGPVARAPGLATLARRLSA